MSSLPFHFAVGIATRGRPAILLEVLEELNRQLRRPDSIVVAHVEASDVEEAPVRFPHIRFLQVAQGLTCQRNAILDQLGAADFVTFLDDDFLLEPRHLAIMEEVLTKHPEIVIATGNVLADGIHGPGLECVQARSILQASSSATTQTSMIPVFNAYGCNMTLRMEPIRAHQLRFDEQLPLYGWYEDVDFCRRLAPFGKIVKIEQAQGVHLGVKSGRHSGLRLGYSQIANPIYLAKKGSVSWFYAVASMTSRFLKNLVFSVRPEPLIDRRGRLEGNVRAVTDMIRGALHPTRILSL